MERDNYGLTEVQRSLICRLLHSAYVQWDRGENPHELNNHELNEFEPVLEIFAPRS